MDQILASFFTVVTGFLVFTLGQITITFFLNPIKRHKEVIGEIQDAIIYYANVFSPMMNEQTLNEARDKFRQLATQLVSTARIIPFYQQSGKIFGLPSLKNIQTAHHSLISLSNSVGHERNSDDVIKNLKKELDLWFKTDI